MKENEMRELGLDELDTVNGGGRITYAPLFRYLEEHNITMYDLIKAGVITATESTRLRSNHNFRMSMVDSLCEYLHCDIEDVIEYDPDYPI